MSRPSVENSSRRYSAVLEHKTSQAFFLRTNSAYKFLDLADLKRHIQQQVSDPTDFTVFNVLRQCYTKDALGKKPSISRGYTTASTRKLGSQTTRSVSTFRTPLTTKGALFPLTRSTPRKAQSLKRSAKLETIDSQCRQLRDTLVTERQDTVKQRREALASMSGVRNSLESKIAQGSHLGLPAPLLALRSQRRLISTPDTDNLEVSKQLQEYRRHLWTNAMKKSLTKEMRYVYTLGTCTVLPKS